jgi:hypothetical protein
MVKKTKPRTRVDSFLDVVRSEIAAGNAGLTAWLKHLESANGINALFELEAWLKGMRAFFDPQYLPLRESERAALAERSFHPEMEILRQALQRCERCALEVSMLGQPEKIRFETFIERKSRRGTVPGCNVDQVFEEPTPLDSLAGIEESLRDIRLLMSALDSSAGIDYRVYRSLGRQYDRALKGHRFIEMLLSQRLRQQYDQVDNPFLRGILDGIKDYRLKRSAALSFLYLLRLLKYLALVGRELEQDHPLRETLVLFALVHEEMGYLAEFLKARFLKGRESSRTLRDSVGLIIYSLHMEGGRTQKQELVSAAADNDVASVYSCVQNSHGLLRNCFQSGVVTLAKSLNKQVEARNVYPALTDSASKSLLLRQDLSELRSFLKEMLDGRPEPVLDEIIGRMSRFREKSLPLLMYKDWADFEMFSDGIVSAASSMEARILLRKFISYIETLIQEVSKRSSFSHGDADTASGQ